MNTIQNNSPDDKLLKDDLEKLGQGYQRLDPEEPPELLDQAILNSAHRAVKKKAGWMDFGWIHGLTTAAVVVLALTIILTQRQPVPLEESGISPVDAVSLDRARSAESSLPESRLERQAIESEYKEDLSTEYSLKSRNSLSQRPPAASTLEEETLPVNAPVKAIVAKRAAAATTDKPTAAEPARGLTAAVEIDVDSAGTDKFEAERSQLPTEELLLQAILKLKRDGDESWKTELKSFMESYPDYPLPDELTY